MIDAVFAELRATAQGWNDEARRRRTISAVDPVADTLEHVASALRDQLQELEADTYFLSVEEYARLQGVTPQSVRLWIRTGQLSARRTTNGYRVRRDAQRRKIPA